MRKITATLVSLLLGLCLVAQPVLAEGGKGNGEGSGGGKDQPLIVEKTVPQENESVTDGRIVLTFSKNVANETVKDANEGLVSVSDKDGKEVEFTVEIADEQLEPDKRNDIVIILSDNIVEGSYQVIAKAGISSKSGDVLEEDYVLNFKVGEAANEEKSEEVVKDKEEKQEAKAEVTSAKNDKNYVPFIVGGLVLVGLVVFVVVKKKKK